MALYFEAIYTQTVGAGGAANITFNNIPQTYRDLYILTSIRDGRTDAGYSNVLASVNLDASAIYSYTTYAGILTTPNASIFTSTNGQYYNYAAGANVTAGVFSGNEIYISNYTGSTFKTLCGISAIPNNVNTANGNLIQQSAALYRSTSAITSMRFTAINGVFAQHSTFSIYGVRSS
jgi:hypothetical protein